MIGRGFSVLALAAGLALGPTASAWALQERDIPELRRLTAQIENDSQNMLDDLRDRSVVIPGRGNRRISQSVRRFIDATEDFRDDVGIAYSRRSLVNDSLERMNDHAGRLRSQLADPALQALAGRDWNRIERRLARVNDLYWRSGPRISRDADRAYRLFQSITR